MDGILNHFAHELTRTDKIVNELIDVVNKNAKVTKRHSVALILLGIGLVQTKLRVYKLEDDIAALKADKEDSNETEV